MKKEVSNSASPKAIKGGETSPAFRITVHDEEIPCAQGYRYPMYGQVNVDYRVRDNFSHEIVSKINTSIEHLMLRQNENTAVLIVELKKKTKKNGRIRVKSLVPKARAKIIITSLNDIERATNDFVSQVSEVGKSISDERLLMHIRVGAVNTLECLSDPRQDDEFEGFNR
jgi:hypothetical protein